MELKQVNSENSKYLSLIIHIATINSFKRQILGNVRMDKNTHKSSICHHKLAKKTNIVKIENYEKECK